MGTTEETPDWAKAEIAEAIRILREDGLGIHRTYKQFMDSQNDPPKDETEETEGKPPPAKDTPTEPVKKKGAWWSDRA
jgi:hypothetical protein